jgi:urea transport system permease protein
MTVSISSGRGLARPILWSLLVLFLAYPAYRLACWLVTRFGEMSFTDYEAALSNSLSLGSILILTALGLAITFGVMRVINMAHGDMMMLGAYTAFVMTDSNAMGILVRNLGGLLGKDWRTDFGLHFNLYYAIPAAFLVTALAGFLLEICLVRFLYKRPLDSLLATWGAGMIIQQVVKLLFGANLQPMHLPEALQEGWTIGHLTIPRYRVFIAGITLLCLLAVYLWFYRTSFGLKIRAVVQNRPMASAMGISTRRVDSITFAFASGLAGVAGCILAHLYNIKYTMGNDYIVDAFMVVILGGMGQLAGSIGGGAIIGSGNSVVEKLLGNTSMAKVVVLVLVIIFIFIRPSGLFASKERTYD